MSVSEAPPDSSQADAVDTLRVVAEIAAGRFDDAIEDIQSAIVKRVVDGAVGFRWRITVDDLELVVTEDDLTLDEAERVEASTGQTWVTMNPAQSARTCRAILHARLVTLGDSNDKAAAKLAPLTVAALVESIDRYQVTPDPKGRPA